MTIAEMQLHEEWLEYRQACYGKGPELHPIQEKETKQAFFAGMLVIFKMLEQMQELPEEQIMKALQVYYIAVVNTLDPTLAEEKSNESPDQKV